MSTQFSLFGDDALIAFFREQDDKKENQYLEDLKELQARAEAKRNTTLFDFIEIEKILNSKAHELVCEMRTPHWYPSKPTVPDDVRLSILRSFVVLYMWEFIGSSQDKADLWLKTPCSMFNDLTPEQFALHCWHCTRSWMKEMRSRIKEKRHGH